MAHDDLTDDNFDLEDLDAEHESEHDRSHAVPTRSNAQAGLLLLAGFGCAIFGLALSVGPLGSWKASQVMVGLDFLGVHGGTLFIGGMILMGLGMLRRGQHAIAVSADEAHGDTAVVEEMATGVLQMRHALDHLQRVTSQMQEEVGQLRHFCEAEANKPPPPPPEPQVQLASNDAQGEAMFRLAASLDKLGARIEERLKSQFTTLREQLDSVEASATANHEAVEARIEELASQPQPEPVPVFEPEAAPQAASEPATEAEQPTWQAPTEPVAPEAEQAFAQALPEPTAQAFPEPIAQALPEPIAQALPEPTAQAFPEPIAEALPGPIAQALPEVPVDSPLGVLDTIEPHDAHEAQAPLSQPAPNADFSEGLNLADVQQPGPSAALPTAPTTSPWGGELQPGTPEADLSQEERERLLAETRLRQSLQNMQRHPEQGTQDFTG